MSFKKRVHLWHDGINYSWKDVPDKKYINWSKMAIPFLNTSDFTVSEYPYMLQIEPTNMCNLSCPLCPVSENRLERKPRNMSLKEFMSIIDDMEDYLLFLILWEWGEPLVNPKLPAMIKYASERGIKTVTSTNAHFLNKKPYVEELLRSGLSTLIVAIDSLDEESYKVYRSGGDLNKAISGLINLCELKKQLGSNTRINLRMVIMKQNERELPAMRDFAKKIRVDTFSVKTLNPSCGLDSMDQELLPGNPKYRRYDYKKGTSTRIRLNTYCSRVWKTSNIFSNGDVVPCGYDYNCEMKVGNVFEEPFGKIWNSPAYKELRKKIYYQKDSFPKCKECTINYKLSKGGWFPEVQNFNVGIKQRI
ncbi:radical SAM/SPASM domain-containing protein, partial [Candidatus Neomarinimicrobiota bacterium]